MDDDRHDASKGKEKELRLGCRDGHNKSRILER
jgi:hypothetical protein